VRLKTAAAGLVVGAVLVGGVATFGPKLEGLGGVSSSYTMSKPKVRRLPTDPHKYLTIVQVCYWPSDSGQQVRASWALGSAIQLDLIGKHFTCRDPYGKSATLEAGARAMIGWEVTAGVVGNFQARITVNGRQAMYYDGPQGKLKLDCYVGTPPCN
jgi:hypothetical protein